MCYVGILAAPLPSRVLRVDPLIYIIPTGTTKLEFFMSIGQWTRQA
jgi:hypothetical protein